MYLAHSGVALAARAVEPEVPLHWWLVASWTFDLTGVGHWLPVAVPILIAVYLVGHRRWGTRTAALLTAVVASHSLLDLAVGLQLVPSGGFIGANLRARSPIELAIEVFLISVGWLIYQQRHLGGRLGRSIPALAVLLLFTAVRFVIDDGSSAAHRPEGATLGLMLLGVLVSSASLIWADSQSPEAAVVPHDDVGRM